MTPSHTSVPPFHGNINFNAQHAPAGAFMSFTCGHFGSGGGIGVELGKPAAQNLFIGIKDGPRRSEAPIVCLPFFRDAQAQATTASNYDVENPNAAGAMRGIRQYESHEIQRHYGWASDGWATPGMTLNIFTPFQSIPDPQDPATTNRALRQCLCPAVLATLTVDNTHGRQTKTAVFAIDFIEPGARLLCTDASAGRLGFAWRRGMGVLGALDGQPAQALFAFQRWSVADGLENINPLHELGTCAGLGFEVPAGEKRTLVLSLGVYLDGVVTTGLESRYYYTRCFTDLSDVLYTGLDMADDIRMRCHELNHTLLHTGLSEDQQFLIAHGTRSYYGSTQLLDVGGEPFWIVNEGEYCMMNTLDLSIDHAFWELEHNPWVVRNVLDRFARHYRYHDQCGISFTHDMGANNNFSRPGYSSYELANLTGCFSYMTQEQLCNWVLLAACYVAKTGDDRWLRENAPLLDACAQSMYARADPDTGVMSRDSSRCGGGSEITTYDSLDESLGQARANTYLAVKCWATWIGLDLMRRMIDPTPGSRPTTPDVNLANAIATHLLTRVTADGAVPAVLEADNPGYGSRILPAIEALVYPTYWLQSMRQREADPRCIAMLNQALSDPMIDTLRDHTLKLLLDPQHRNRFRDGGLRLSSTSNNSWMSKIALFQFAARQALRLCDEDRGIADLFTEADAAHVRWQTDGSGYWACSDQFISGVAKGSRYYPRLVTASLWLSETRSHRTTQSATPSSVTTP